MKFSTLTLILMVLASTLCAGVSYTYTLDSPIISSQGTYTDVKLANAQSWGEPGNPDLPWLGVKLLLPVGTEASTLNIKRYNPVYYDLKSPISPIQQQYPFSHKVTEPRIEPNAGIYQSAVAFPTKTYNELSTYFLSGNPIAFTAVSPFEYSPKTNKLTFYRTISVDVDYKQSARAIDASSLLKQDAFTAMRLRQTVDNATDITTNTTATRTTGYNYLMIIDQEKLSNWQPLKDLYESRGLNVLIKPVSEIIANNTGIDTQDKIRNYIISVYSANPLRYVFLAGDTDVIPHRGMYVNMGSEDGYIDDDIPADMYYSCLDGNWNTDGDAFWGEYVEADLAPELAIGRFCYNSDTEIANFLNKVMIYMLAPVENEIKTAFFAGEWLWDGPTWAGDYMDEMIAGSSANGYTTIGVPTSWDISTLYDRTFGSADSWGASQIRPMLSQGANFVNHLGHSNTTYNMRLSNNQVSSTSISNNGSNHNFSIYFTQGCYAGSFDNRDTEAGSYTNDCISEKFTSISTAAAAMISHSRYGWGVQGSTDGASQYLHREYIDAIFGENIHELGYTLVDSKIDNIPYITGTAVMHWVDYETNLFGDPAMMLWTDQPQIVTTTLPSEWMVGLNHYQIFTNAPYGEFILKNGADTIYQSYANASGLITVNMFSNLTPGIYQIYINAPNFYTYETAITVTATQTPYIVCNNYQFNDADGLHHTGEELTVSFYAKNVGLLDLNTPGTITLSSSSQNIQILNGTTALNSIATGDSLALQTAFQFKIVGNFVDASQAKLIFTANYDNHTSQSVIYLPLNAPDLHIVSYQVNNNASAIMPGDSPTLAINFANLGSGNASSPMLILMPESNYVTLSETELFFSALEHNSTLSLENALTLHISLNTPIDTNLVINYILFAENGNTIEGSFIVHIGELSFSFEPDFQGWESVNLNTTSTNQWHRSSTRNHTSNGTYSMKFGGTGSAQYSGSAYGALESPALDVYPNCQLKFYHWMQAENHDTSAAYAWDGGLVQMQLNGGTWTQITPVGNYPYRIYSNPASPFATNTYVYSGNFDWTEATFELGNVNGTAKFRWIFGSDGAVSGEGWYIDDVKIVGTGSANEDEVITVKEVQLSDNFPNPFNPTTTLRFSLPTDLQVSLDIYNVKGQLVRRLLDTPLSKGHHDVVWDGSDANNHTVSSGVYYYRIITPLGTKTKKMLMMK
ncbi:MAG: C25 family cysteine peptidase [Candidatus Cloacimonetes bacterium]|nr:C25 family cysteine peptidase [Candidatus Cloacimonadota bacterium]